MTVCKTEDECALNAGEVCATYPGLPADPKLPVVLHCVRTLRGKFLRVRQQIGYLQICECVVNSHSELHYNNALYMYVYMFCCI